MRKTKGSCLETRPGLFTSLEREHVSEESQGAMCDPCAGQILRCLLGLLVACPFLCFFFRGGNKVGDRESQGSSSGSPGTESVGCDAREIPSGGRALETTTFAARQILTDVRRVDHDATALSLALHSQLGGLGRAKEERAPRQIEQAVQGSWLAATRLWHTGDLRERGHLDGQHETSKSTCLPQLWSVI